jgi:hypothetical protein
MNASASGGGTGGTLRTKEAEIHQAVENALRQLEEHAGEEGYR